MRDDPTTTRLLCTIPINGLNGSSPPWRRREIVGCCGGMMQESPAGVFLRKAEECLAGAASELASNRFHNCANRCYYACFLAAVYALRRAGTQPTGRSDAWSHAFVQAQFAGQLVDRLKRYPAELRDTLTRTFILRRTADYTMDEVSRTQASRAFERARTFVAAVQREGR